MANMLQLLTAVLSGIIVAIVSAVISVRLALRRFYSEKWWERKAAAYTDIIQALSHMQLYTSIEIEAAVQGQNISAEREKELVTDARRGRDEIRRAAAAGTFLISDEALRSVKDCLRKLEMASETDDYLTYLEGEIAAVTSCLNTLPELAKHDLGLGSNRSKRRQQS